MEQTVPCDLEILLDMRYQVWFQIVLDDNWIWLVLYRSGIRRHTGVRQRAIHYWRHSSNQVYEEPVRFTTLECEILQ